MRGVYYIWEQPRSIAATGHAVGLLHWLGGGRGGHSSLQLGGFVCIQEGIKEAT
jgi:hypothetical protein